MKRKIALLLSAAMLLALCAACNGGEKNPESGGSTPPAGSGTDQPAGDGGKTRDSINVALSADVATLDPLYTSSATDNLINGEIYRGLVHMSPENEPQPSLAEKWDMAEDGLSYTFYLRQDVKFHNGETMNADDVIFSVDRALKSPFVASTFGMYCSGAEKIDEHTVKLNLKQPYAPFLTLLDTNFVIHSKKAFEDAGSDEAFFDHPIGCGPYQFVEHKSGESVTLQAFDDFFGGAPAIKTVVFKVITDPNTVSVALETGEIDFAGYGSNVPASNLPLLEEKEGLKTMYVDGSTVNYLTMNNQAEPFNNPNLRKAVAHAIDKQFVIDVVENGKGTPAQTMIAPAAFGYPEQLQGYSYDVDKAKQYLADAGYPDGAGLPEIELKLMEGKSKTACEAIQSQLQTVGIPVKLTIMEKNAYLNDVMGGNYTIGYLGITLAPDAASFSQLYTSPNVDALNTARYVNAEADALFSEGEVTADPAARQEAYDKVYQLVEQDCAYVPVYYPQSAYVYNKNLDIGPQYPTGVYFHQFKFVS